MRREDMALNITANDPSPYQWSTTSLLASMGSRFGADLRGIQGECFRQETKRRAQQIPVQHFPGFAALSEPDLLGAVSPGPQTKFAEFSASAMSGKFCLHGQATISDTPFTAQPGTQKSWLTDALAELDQIDQEAAEDELPPSNELAKGNARRILIELANRTYPQPAVYPTEEGEIGILFQNRSAQAGILILIDNALVVAPASRLLPARGVAPVTTMQAICRTHS